MTEKSLEYLLNLLNETPRGLPQDVIISRIINEYLKPNKDSIIDVLDSALSKGLISKKNDGAYVISIDGEDFLKKKKTKNPSSTTTVTISGGSVGTVVTGDQINITKITNILQDLKKEIENEPNLTSKEKEELQNVIQKESTRWDEVKVGFAKYGGKFVGQTLRSFVGLD